MSNITPATIKVAPRPVVTVTHNDRAPMTYSIGGAIPALSSVGR